MRRTSVTKARRTGGRANFLGTSGCLRQVRSGSQSLTIGKANALTRERIRKELLHLRVLRLGFFQKGMSRSVSWAGVLPPNGCNQIALKIRSRTPPTHNPHI